LKCIDNKERGSRIEVQLKANVSKIQTSKHKKHNKNNKDEILDQNTKQKGGLKCLKFLEQN
jgi:hypothetical protein